MPEGALALPYYEGDPRRGLRELYKADLTQFAKAEQEAQNRAKSTVSSLISSYNTAKSQSLQEEIVTTMKRYESFLPANLRIAVEPYIAHGPTSPMAEKSRQFREIMGDPPRPPILNEAPGETAEMQNMNAMTQHYFALEDYERQKEIFLLGAETARPKASFMMFPGGKGAAVRNKEGQITYLSERDLNLKDIETRLGFAPKDVILNQGMMPTGNKGFLQVNGRKITTEDVFNVVNETYSSKVVNTESMPASQWDIKHPANLVKVMMQWKMKKPEDDAVKDLKKRASKSPAEGKKVEQDLKTIFPQYSFNIIRKAYEPWWSYIPFLSADDKIALIPIRGEPMGLPNKSGKLLKVWYDPDLDLVSNKYGIPMGGLERVKAEIAGRE